MTLEENIRVILECNFTGYKDEIIEVATKRIIKQIERQNPIVEELEKIRLEMNSKGWYNRYDKEQFAEIIEHHISELKGEDKP